MLSQKLETDKFRRKGYNNFMMRKKKIAILLPAMRMGGAEKICLNFLEYLKKEYEVTLILSIKEGDLLSQVPDDIRIIEDRIMCFKEIVRQDIKAIRIRYLWKDFLYYMKIKFRYDLEKNYSYLISRTSARSEYYDCAIGYVANISTQIFSIIKRINAEVKIAWIHGETTELKDTNLFQKYYNYFDKIYAVSDVTKQHFINRFPECEDKTDVYYNPINERAIKERAKEPVLFEFNKKNCNIVTVGRVTPEKGMDMIPDIVCRLLEKKVNIHWFIVGDGVCLNNIKQSVEHKGISEYVTFAGNQLNPYPFIAKCDIYVQPSYEEGYSTTICEAGILGKAVIATTTSGGIREQIIDGESGLIAEPTSEDLTEQILTLIENPSKRKILEKNILSRDFSNALEFEKLKNFLNGEK